MSATAWAHARFGWHVWNSAESGTQCCIGMQRADPGCVHVHLWVNAMLFSAPGYMKEDVLRRAEAPLAEHVCCHVQRPGQHCPLAIAVLWLVGVEGEVALHAAVDHATHQVELGSPELGKLDRVYKVSWALELALVHAVLSGPERRSSEISVPKCVFDTHKGLMGGAQGCVNSDCFCSVALQCAWILLILEGLARVLKCIGVGGCKTQASAN